MRTWSCCRKSIVPLTLALIGLAAALPAQAVPSFARQTGAACTDCHVGAFGPQLTPHGMKFKLEGYTEKNNTASFIPLSGMIIASVDRVKTSIDGQDGEDKIQEATVFLAGRLTEHLGVFAEAGTGNREDWRMSLGGVDVRFAGSTKLFGEDTILGVTVNNRPTVQDPLNTLPVWRFPYTGSDLVEANSEMLSDRLGEVVWGTSVYTFWKGSFYAEIGAYTSPSESYLNKVNQDPGDKIDGAAPYWRLAYIGDRHKDAWSVGLFGMNAKLHEGYDKQSPTDDYRDLGVDASYQFLGGRQHVFTVNTAFIDEHVDLNATIPGESVTLQRFDVAGSYHYNQTYGATLSYFNTHGTANAARYEKDKDGNVISQNGSPNAAGYTLQLDWTPLGKEGSWGEPWANVRVGAQYTWYNKFNGAKDNYDGNGRNADDNNTLNFFIWTAF